MSYTRRLRAERRLSKLPMLLPAAMLSDNHKTHTSINLSVLNCRPAVPGAAWENTGYFRGRPRQGAHRAAGVGGGGVCAGVRGLAYSLR